MRFVDFVGFYYTASMELDVAEKMEGFLTEMYPGFPITRGEYVKSAINHLRETLENLDVIKPYYIKRLDELKARCQRLEARDKSFYKGLLKEFESNYGMISSLLDRAEGQYFFFGGETEEGYTNEQFISEILFRLEITAVRLQGTKAFPMLRLNIGIAKDDLEKVLERDREFREMITLN